MFMCQGMQTGWTRPTDRPVLCWAFVGVLITKTAEQCVIFLLFDPNCGDRVAVWGRVKGWIAEITIKFYCTTSSSVPGMMMIMWASGGGDIIISRLGRWRCRRGMSHSAIET